MTTPAPRVTNEQLAKQLMECAILVKRGERTRLVSQTIQDLTEYLRPARRTEGQQAVAARPSKPAHNTFGILGKALNEVIHPSPQKTDASKKATSSKNAARIKADLEHGSAGKATWFGGHDEELEWCEEHFCLGCGCKEHKEQQRPEPTQTRSPATVSTPAQNPVFARKPPFQRPTNPRSPLVANGWIEQQRRSKMRTVWKEVLASLVEGRKPGEETTLWIQREIPSSSGKPELEALHQIPVKWLQEVTYQQYSADNKFTLKVYNLPDEFVFRCENSEEAAQNWVSTLQSLREISQKSNNKNQHRRRETAGSSQSVSFDEEKKVPEQSYPQRPSAPSVLQDNAVGGTRISVTELRAIAHGAGINTIGMERGELEAAVARLSNGATAQQEAEWRKHQQEDRRQNVDEEQSQIEHEEEIAKRRAAEEDAIRRREEEAARRRAEEEVIRQKASEEESARRRMAEEEAKRLKAVEEEAARRRAIEEEAIRRKAAEEEARRQAAEEEKVREAKEAEEHRRLIAEKVRASAEAERLKREEEERRRLEAERLRKEEEDHRRRIAEQQAAEQKRRQDEALRRQQQQWQQQQQSWQKQQAEEEQRRRMAEQHAAEERRRREEAYRQQQQQQQQQPSSQQWQRPQQAQWQHQQQQWQNQQMPRPQPQPSGFAGHPHQAPHHPPPPHSSPIDSKYAKMAHQTENGGRMTTQGIKHGILVEWALQPPQLQVLRPIEVLICSIHTVFPPKFGVRGHEYYSKWSSVCLSDVTDAGHHPDDEKLKKVVRKLRFFLHPDKLPKDLSTDQTFVCKLLWDITNDAWEEHKKKEEDLGWMRA